MNNTQKILCINSEPLVEQFTVIYFRLFLGRAGSTQSWASSPLSQRMRDACVTPPNLENISHLFHEYILLVLFSGNDRAFSTVLT